MALISQFSAFSYKGRALSFPQASLCHAVERKRAGNVGKEKGQEGGARPLSSVPHEPSCFLFLTSSALFTCLIILFSFLEYHWQPLRKRENQARTIFFKIRKNKQTNKCSKAGRDITRTWWTLVLSEHGPYFHTRVLGESAKRQSADTFTRHRRISAVDQCCIISAELTTQEQWWWWWWQWWWWWHFFRRRSSFFFLLSIDALQKFNRNENHS